MAWRATNARYRSVGSINRLSVRGISDTNYGALLTTATAGAPFPDTDVNKGIQCDITMELCDTVSKSNRRIAFPNTNFARRMTSNTLCFPTESVTSAQDITDEFEVFPGSSASSKELLNPKHSMRVNIRKSLNGWHLIWYDIKCYYRFFVYKYREVPILNEKIKEIEGVFGYGISSFFIFLRYLIVINMVLAVLWILFVIFPMATRFDYSSIKKPFYLRNIFDGGSAVEEIWFFYQGYTQEDQWEYPIDVAYITLTAISYYGTLFSILRSVAHAVDIETLYEKNVLPYKFSFIVLSFWDYSLCSPEGVEYQSMGITNTIRDTLIDLQVQADLRVRTRQQQYNLYARRALVWFLTLILVSGGVGLIMYLVLIFDLDAKVEYWFGKGADDNFIVKYSVPLIFGIINSTVPWLIEKLTVAFEHYESGKVEMNVIIIRTFGFRMTNMFALVGSIFRTVNSKNSDICTGTLLGQYMYRILISDIFITIVYDIIYTFGWHSWTLTKYPFALPNAVLRIVYKQGIIWAGMMACPILPLVGSLSLYVYFIITHKLIISMGAPPEKRWSQARHNHFFYAVITLTLIVFIIPLSISLGTTGILDFSATSGNTTCGPFPGIIPLRAYPIWFEKKIPLFNDVTYWLTSVVVILPVIMLLIGILYYLQMRIRMEKKKSKQLGLELKEERDNAREILKRLNIEIAVRTFITRKPIERKVFAADLAVSSITLRHAS